MGRKELLAPVPDELKRSDHAFQSGSRFSQFTGNRSSNGAGATLAIPLTGDGYVIVYRSDRFADPDRAEGVRESVSPRTGRAEVLGGVCRDCRFSSPNATRSPACRRYQPTKAASSTCFPESQRRRTGVRSPTPTFPEKVGRNRDTLGFQFVPSTSKPRLSGAGRRLPVRGGVVAAPPDREGDSRRSAGRSGRPGRGAG